MAPAPYEACNIRDDGVVYLPWTEYAKRLSLAFGPFSWAMVPLDRPMVRDNAVFVHYALHVRGRFVSEAMQSHPYYANNRQQNYDDAVESAKSECLRRCCKVFGGALEPWDAAWREAWKKDYTVFVKRTRSGKWAWRRKDAQPFDDEALSRHSHESEYSKPARLDDEVQAHMDSVGREDDADFRSLRGFDKP
jgi:Mitochondrial genome maintenance MGM101